MIDVSQKIQTSFKSILVVDDDQDDRDILRSAIEKIDKEIVMYEVSDSKNIIEDISKLGCIPEVIFLDINMPKMNGKECIKILFEDSRFKDIPKIMYSTSDSNRDIIETFELGANYYLQKPTSYQLLIRILKSIVNKELELYSPKGLDQYFLNAYFTNQKMKGAN